MRDSGAMALSAVADHLARLLEVARLLVLGEDAAGDEVGPGDELAGVLVDRQHGEQQPVLREVAAVAQDDVADVADALAVDEHAPGGDRLAAARAGGVDLERLAVLEQEHRVLGQPDRRAPAAGARRDGGTRRAPARSSAAAPG